MAVMYNMIFIIARLAFGQLMEYQLIFFGLDLFFDFLYGMDIGLKREFKIPSHLFFLTKFRFLDTIFVDCWSNFIFL